MILGGGDSTVGLIEERRRLDKLRLQRIKDPKTRTMGINTEALAAQVAAKQAAKQEEVVRNLAYDNERLLLDQQLAYLEQARPRPGPDPGPSPDPGPRSPPILTLNLTRAGAPASGAREVRRRLPVPEDLPGRREGEGVRPQR